MSLIEDALGKLSSVTGASKAMSAVTNVVAAVAEQIPAMIVVILDPKTPVPIGAIPCDYNPETLTFSKTAQWTERETTRNDTPKAVYGGGEPEQFSLDLFFDTTESGLDVRLYTSALMALTHKLPILNHPPLCKFVWGTMSSPISYVQTVTVKYLMFRPEGFPIRAEANITMREYNIEWLKLLPMNPTSRSEARKTWVVVEGQTLPWIAYQEYGDSAHWRHIAQTNHLLNPMSLRPGQILKLTPLPDRR